MDVFAVALTNMAELLHLATSFVPLAATFDLLRLRVVVGVFFGVVSHSVGTISGTAMRLAILTLAAVSASFSAIF